MEPREGGLGSGLMGKGRLPEPSEIVDEALQLIQPRRDLAGRKVLVTAGTTREPLDPVRYIGNRSTGKMGVAVAAEALARGARVTLVLGPGTVRPPVGVEVIDVGTDEEMRAAVGAHEAADGIAMAAAVADFRPKLAADRKLKKDDGMPELQFEPTPDILAELGERKRAGQILVGFAAETHDVEAAGRDKLARKGLEVVNVDPGLVAPMGWPLDARPFARLNEAYGTEVELKPCFLHEAGLPG